MKADYHLHCEFSDDSQTLMEQQIERAIELGLDEICFTDHVDYGIKNDWDDEVLVWRNDKGVEFHNTNNVILANVNYPEYFAKINRMRRIYGDRITIKAGLEFGIQRHTIEKYQQVIEKYDHLLDFCLLSIHQVDDKEFWTGDYMVGKTQKEYNEQYYDELLYVVTHFDNYDVLAHVDLFNRYDPNGIYPFELVKDKVTKIFETIISKGKGIEINTSSWHYGLSDTTPSRDMLKLYLSLGGKILTMGSDGHSPKYVGDHFDDAREILKELGFKSFYTFEKHQPIEHEL